MNHRRREGLGRNRGGPTTRNYVPISIAGMAVIIGLALYAYSYLAAPQRVFGANVLKCPATEITWGRDGSATVIRGCGKTIVAVCNKKSCREQTPDDYGIQF